MGTRGEENSAWRLPNKTNAYHSSNDASFFSVSLPILSCEKLNYSRFDQSSHGFPNFSKLHIEDNIKNPLEEAEDNLADDFDLSWLPTQLEDLEDDIFGSGGGLEIENKSKENLVSGASRASTSGTINSGGISDCGFANGVGSVSSQHPYGERPSRTLFVRNINSSAGDSELRSLFQEYGDIRTLYTACKSRGFVLISYYDLRAARTAMHALQNKPLRGRKLDIHYSVPKDNPSEKELNQGTLVVFNLDPHLSTDEIIGIFGAYGQIMEIRETPNKKGHKFIEYYDTRAAAAALKYLNRSEICGKRIKLEPSRPGGDSRSLTIQHDQESEQEEPRTFLQQVGSPIANYQPGSRPKYGYPVEQNSLHDYSVVPNLGQFNSVGSDQASGLASILPFHPSGVAEIASVSKYPSLTSQGITPKPTQGIFYHPHFSVPDAKLSLSPGFVSPHIDFNGSSVGTFSGPEYIRGSPSQKLMSSALPLSSLNGGQEMGFPYTGQHPSIHGSPHHLIGSAPSRVQLDGNFGYLPQSPVPSYINQPSVGLGNFGQNKAVHVGSSGLINRGTAFAGNLNENSIPNSQLKPISRDGTSSFGKASLGDGMLDRGQVRSWMDQNKQFKLDLGKIIKGEDTRTTVMIKNIPNKYTSKMLLSSINETHKGTYDFLYLPIDFKNKCNVGYAFINMVSPSHIISLYEVFNGKRWETFNSEKVASLAYARIQGKNALLAHFENSSIMHEDKSCRPIVFETEKQDHLLSANQKILLRRWPHGSYAGNSWDGPRRNQNYKQYVAKNKSPIGQT